jgi:hypothetical protein
MEIVTIYTVTDYKTGKQYEEAIIGDGQAAAKAVRAMYPRHTKFVVDGFEIDGTYVPLYIKNRYND